jgi:copper(I)-binding protein
VTVAVLAVSAAALSACGTGLQAQTYREVGRQDGASITVDKIAVRDLHVVPPLTGASIPKYETAVVSGVLVNEGDTADALVGASTDSAATATLEDGGQPSTSIPLLPHGMATTWTINLRGLTKPLEGGRFINVTLTFNRARQTTLQVPIRAGDTGLAQRTPEQNPYGEGKA